MVSTPCSSTKSRRLRDSSFAGLNAASTIVDRNTSIVDSSLAFAASRVRMTLWGDLNQPHIHLLKVTASAYLEILLAIFINVLDSSSDSP
jgi:hypothetical protein